MLKQWKPWLEKKRFSSEDQVSLPILFSLLTANIQEVPTSRFSPSPLWGCFVQLYSELSEKFERKFVIQRAPDTHIIFQSLDLAWTWLRIFPRELLHRRPLTYIYTTAVKQEADRTLGLNLLLMLCIRGSLSGFLLAQFFGQNVVPCPSHQVAVVDSSS